MSMTVARLIATWGGCGFLPKMPGTWGSLAALPFAWGLHSLGGWPLLGGAALLTFGVGIWASGVAARTQGLDDPSEVVIDEVAGQWLTLAVVPPDLLFYVLGFILFRIADILKPWPVSWADRNLKGGLGIMLDDVLAAVYAGVVLFLLHELWTKAV